MIINRIYTLINTSYLHTFIKEYKTFEYAKNLGKQMQQNINAKRFSLSFIREAENKEALIKGMINVSSKRWVLQYRLKYN